MIDRAYQSHFATKRLKRRLIETADLPLLESIIETASNELLRQQREEKAGLVAFGKTATLNEIIDFFPRMRHSVDHFLGVDGLPAPKVRFKTALPSVENSPQYFLLGGSVYWFSKAVKLFHAISPDIHRVMDYCRFGAVDIVLGCVLLWYTNQTSGYSWLMKRIGLKKDSIENLIPVLGHEYTHYVHAQLWGRWGITVHTALAEGLAMRTQDHVARLEYEKTGNSAYLSRILDDKTAQCKVTYRWICTHRKKTPDKALLSIVKEKNPDIGYVVWKGMPSRYGIGHTFISLEEATQGPDVCKDILHGRHVLR